MPFIWADPEVPGGDRTNDIGQTHDIGVTILERARLESAIGMQGRSLLQEGSRDAAFIQYGHQKDNPGIGIGPRVHTIRRGRWRLSLIDGVAWGELYDLEDDPGEFRNLWDDPAYSATRAALVEHLARAESRTVDRAPFPTGRARPIEGHDDAGFSSLPGRLDGALESPPVIAWVPQIGFRRAGLKGRNGVPSQRIEKRRRNRPQTKVAW